LGHILDAVGDRSRVGAGREVLKMRTTSHMALIAPQPDPLQALPWGPGLRTI
jgi:hypothetical protein